MLEIVFMSCTTYSKLLNEFFAILGPCVMESLDHTLFMAEKIKTISEKTGIPVVFKASFDKANRTSIHSFRGPGIDEGLNILQKVKDYFGLLLTTDIHEPNQAKPVAQVVDILQIPAFLCRQTDLIVEAAKTGRVLSIKKGQFVAPTDMSQAVEKCHQSGNANVFLIERGTTFGYNNLVVDMRSFAMMTPFAPTIFDATHSLQLPGKGGTHSGGQREFLPQLALAAVAAGAKALFLETHNDPACAKSDAQTVYPLEKVEPLLRRAHSLYHECQTFYKESENGSQEPLCFQEKF
jgi:2-dehydro-3-deoxyphosphooctonate aldolase (KDO 8-P synthase)